jgi:hypothetical protein
VSAALPWVLALALALVLGAQLAIAVSLALTPPRWRALAALLVPPLGPFWAWQVRRLRPLAWAWALGVAIYAAAVALA